jgi:hypothetical protein
MWNTNVKKGRMGMKTKILKQICLGSLLTLGAFQALAEVSLEDMELITDSYTFEELSDLSHLDSHYKRIESNSSTSCRLSGKSTKEKADIFNRAANRLLNVNNFENIISLPGQDFILRDSLGNKVYRPVIVGDLVEIQLPMDPTFRTYWVKVEQLKKIPNQVSMIVRPTANPLLSKKKNVTDHFFTNAATNTFSVTNTGDQLVARVHGLNEEVNTSQVRSWKDAVANGTIATMAWGFYYEGKAKMGIQSYTWKSLTSHLADCN